MTRAEQVEFEQEVCRATGEDRRTVRTHGFSLMVLPARGPLSIDWDAVQAVEHPRYIPRRALRRRRLAA
jgi:hypothetical protein